MPKHLPAAACTGHIIPGFTNNLISLGKLCDNGCTATLDKHHLIVRDGAGHTILHGKRETAGARLWRVNLGASSNANTAGTPTRTATACIAHPYTPTLAARAYDLPSTPALIAFLHATAGFPVKQTWLAAIKRGAYASWPGLTYTLAARYCPSADETLRGHTAQPRQHIRSTRQTPGVAATGPLLDATHSMEVVSIPINQLFTDDTGRFTPRSRSGNQYIMVAIHRPSNAILIRPFASKNDSHRIAAYQDIYQRLAACGAAPTLHILDNEISTAYQRAITANDCTYQLVPPHVH